VSSVWRRQATGRPPVRAQGESTEPLSGSALLPGLLGKVTLKSGEILPECLFYLMNTAGVREQIRGSASGAMVRHTSPSRIYEVSVELPPLLIQQRIATILSAYDELIRNNERRIRVLEDMARSLYREWFVDFRFPGHRETKLINSTIGQIPESWRVAKLKDLTTKIGSGATPRGGKAYEEAGVSLVRSLNIYDYEFEFSNLASMMRRPNNLTT